VSAPILPGATVGILGGGQLGRMLAMAARRMGYRVHVFEPAAHSPAAPTADLVVNKPYEDEKALRAFVRDIDVLTYEFENIPSDALERIEKEVPLRPSRIVLRIAQNRKREKEFLQRHRFPVVPFRIIEREGEIEEALAAAGPSCIMKTADFGYDGKGQRAVETLEEARATWKELGSKCAVLEKRLEFEEELSVIVARSGRGQVSSFPVALNHHEHHILSTTEVPATLPSGIAAQAQTLAEAVAGALNLVGLLAVEMFLTSDGGLFINELAPRPHNSGHFSIDACVTSQFEQQIRAICSLPLGQASLLSPALMRNLLGELWSAGEPPWNDLLELPGLRLHLYGKTEARPGRKMGHYCVLAETLQSAREIDREAQEILRRPRILPSPAPARRTGSR